MPLVENLHDAPAAGLLVLLLLLVVVAPLIFRTRRARSAAQAKDQPVSRFLGIQVDVAILVLGLALLLALIGSIYKAFLG